MIKLKIVSDGTTAGTRVVNQETGEAIGGVLMMNWTASSDETLSEAMLVLRGVPCEIVTSGHEYKLGMEMEVLDEEQDEILRAPSGSTLHIKDILEVLRGE